MIKSQFFAAIGLAAILAGVFVTGIDVGPRKLHHAVLSNLKDLEFHSRANIEKLAELSLTIEEELKQRAFAEGIGAVYAAQDAFQSKILKLIEDYEAECARLSGSA